jgi:two-component SAPR family response regulator/Flp pilus assembly protein TadD
LVRGGRRALLAEWLDALPAATLASRPFCLALRGYVAVGLGEIKRGLSLLNQAEETSRLAGGRSWLARTLVWRAIAHYLLANYKASLADADEALALAEHDEDLRIIQAEALRAKGLSLYRLGQLNEAIAWLEQALVVCNALDDAKMAAILRLELGLAYMSAGRYSQALVQYNQALDHWRKTGNLTFQSPLLNNLGVLYHFRGDYEQAGSLLEEALTCAKQSGDTHIVAATLASLGDLYADLGAAQVALETYDQAHKIAQQINYRFLLLYLDLTKAALIRSNGNLAQVRELLASAGRLAQETGSPYEAGLRQLEMGRLALAEDNVLEAVTHLEGAARHFDDGGQPVEGARAYLYLALAQQRLGDERTAMAHLGNAFYQAANLETWHPLVVAGREAKFLLEAAQGDPTLGRQAARLLRQVVEFERNIPALRRCLRRQASAIPFAPPRLIIQALGKTQVTLDGKVLTNADWQVKGARDLFFYLLAHPDGKSKEALGAVFWPDDSPGQLKLQFKNTIYRLRRALGGDVVLLDEETDYYRFNQELDYEYDVETFWKNIRQAQTAAGPEERAAAYQEAFRLYEGDYLPDVEGTWAWPERERLRDVYMAALLELAESFLAGGDYKTTLAYCRSALAQDPCLEEVHRLAMRAHAALGNRADVVRQFEACRQSLLAELNVPFSPQTEKLYQTLIH